MDMDNLIEEFKHHYDQLRGYEHGKNLLIDRMLETITRLKEEFSQEKLDHQRERQFNRDNQVRTQKMEDDLKKLKVETERDAFVLVLIDGDGMIFEDALIQKGEAGGKEAAGLLWSAIREHVHRKTPDVPSDYKILTRIYANVKGLTDACVRAGILDSSSLIEDFARGFTGNKQLFDFVDVGSGKDRADEKISELFRLNLNNVHCRHILFGCSHDNGYARLLEEVAQSPNINQITLLEGVPFERELATLKSSFATTKFENLFRTTKINVYHQQYLQSQQARPAQLPQSMPLQQMIPGQMQNGVMQSGMVSNGHVSSLDGYVQNGSAQNGQFHGDTSPGYQSPYQPTIPRTASTSTSSSAPPPTSWASKAVAAPPPGMVSPPTTPQPKVPTIPRNKLGQRIDTLTKLDSLEMKRVQKIKMCNVHFLRNDCPYGDECTHSHFYKPNKNELETLRQVARGTPCRYGTGCDDLKCIYGHRCPHSVEGSRVCKYGDNCRFEEDMHGIDLKVVRTLKVA